MSLNGWYKNTTIADVPSLYEYVNNALQINISLATLSGAYSGSHIVNGVWVNYQTQPEMNLIWQAHFAGATPLP